VARLPSISAFFPAYNEEANVTAMVERLGAVLPQVSDDYEIIVVDDGSQDRTAEIATALAAADPRVRLVRHQQNRGYGGALKSGFAASTKSYVFFTDGDGQFDVGEITSLLPYVPQHDVVIGYRIDRAEGGLRRVNAGAWNFLVRNLFGIPSRDVDCAFKLFDRRVFEVVHPEVKSPAMTGQWEANLHRIHRGSAQLQDAQAIREEERAVPVCVLLIAILPTIVALIAAVAVAAG